ncbi:MAG: hypothetical protein ACREJ9_12710 [Candidatus Rokuibacteriota bacterium]
MSGLVLAPEPRSASVGSTAIQVVAINPDITDAWKRCVAFFNEHLKA